jgi:hypothetical protein
LQGLDHLLSLGINLKRVRNGIDSTLSILPRIGRHILGNAIYVVRNINTFIPPQNIVLQGAYKNQLQLAIDYTKKENVLFVEKNLNVENISPLKPVQEFAQPNMAGNIPLSAKDAKPVYNLTVEKDAVYYANGVLVSNCDALAMQQQIARAPIKARMDRQGGIEEVTGYNPLTGKYVRQEMAGVN